MLRTPVHDLQFSSVHAINKPLSSNNKNRMTVKNRKSPSTLLVAGDVLFVVAGVPDERLSSVAVIAWICDSRLLSIWGTWPWVPADDDEDDDDVAGICRANCCCNNCSWSRLNVGSNVYMPYTHKQLKQLAKSLSAINRAPNFYHVTLCYCSICRRHVSMSVQHKPYCIETTGRIKLVFGMEAY